MTSTPLKLLSAPIVERLASEIEQNATRYKSGDFSDLEKESGWRIESSVACWDPAIASQLDPSNTPDAEIKNSLLVYTGMKGMTPAMAREERLWARLCHVECLQFARDRWVKDENDIANAVRLHFFANGLTGCRDDNAIGRLWWNGHMAHLASPENLEQGLRRLLARANIRQQVIERADTAFREPLVRGVVRLLGTEPWFNSWDKAIAFFMLEVNKRSGGIIFEAFDDASIDAHLHDCLKFAKVRHETASSVAEELAAEVG